MSGKIIRRLDKFCKTIKLGQKISEISEPQRYKKSNKLIYKFMLTMSMIGKGSFLQVDLEGRDKKWKKFLGVGRYKDDRLNHCIVSDSTLQERIQKIKREEQEDINYGQLYDLQRQGLVSRIGIIDGSVMSGHYASFLGFKSRYGDCNFVDMEMYAGRGKELEASRKLVKRMSVKLQKAEIELLLVDMLYCNEGIFGLVEQGYVQDVLIKYTPELGENKEPKLFRKILKRFEEYVKMYNKEKKEKKEAFKLERSKVTYRTGTDKKGVSYEIISIDEIDIDPRFKVARIKEKGKKGEADKLFYVITTKKELRGERMREYGHDRWIIENDGFKAMNSLLNSKRKWSKDDKTIERLIMIWILAHGIIWLFRRLNEQYLKEVTHSSKVTTGWVEWLIISSVEYSKEIFLSG